MNELEIALLGTNETLSSYLELVSTGDFRIHVNQMLDARESQDCKSLKIKIKSAIDSI